MLRPDGKKMFYMHSIDVSEKYQNQGIGTKLIEFTLNEIIKENKYNKFFVLADKENISTCKLYEKFAKSKIQVLFSNNV